MSVTVPRSSASALLFAAHSRLTDRDRRILSTLHDHQVLSSDQVARLFFTSLRTGQLRLNVLRGLGLVDRFRHPRHGGGSEPWKWILDWRGARINAATAAAPLPGERTYREHMLRLSLRPDLQHLLAVNEFFIRLQHPSTSSDSTSSDRLPAPPTPESGPRTGRLLRWWPETTATARFAGIHPDGHGIWVPPTAKPPETDSAEVSPAGAVGFWLECDTGTEPLARLVAKLDGYAQLTRSGGPRYPVLFWLPSSARERNLHRLLRYQPPPYGIPVATATHDVTDPAGHVWLSAGDGVRVSLGELPSAHGLESASNPNWIRGRLNLGNQRYERD